MEYRPAWRAVAGALFAAWIFAPPTLAVRPIGVSQLQNTEPPMTVSIISLISNPAAYNGKLVQMVGFVRFEFEGNAIYLHQEDYMQGLYKNGLWLQIDETLSAEERQKLNMQYVLIEGVFSAYNLGHLGLWSGALEQIRRLQPWSSQPILNPTPR